MNGSRQLPESYIDTRFLKTCLRSVLNIAVVKGKSVYPNARICSCLDGFHEFVIGMIESQGESGVHDSSIDVDAEIDLEDIALLKNYRHNGMCKLAILLALS